MVDSSPSSPGVPGQPCVVEVCAIEQSPLDIDSSVLDRCCFARPFHMGCCEGQSLVIVGSNHRDPGFAILGNL